MNTVLIVENYKNQRILYEHELTREGYKVITAVDGKDALKKAQEQRPDLIVMDINIPQMDGLETIGHLLSKNKNIPVILHTAYSHYKDNFMSWAADAYIVKSSDLTELKNKIRELLIRTTTHPPASLCPSCVGNADQLFTYGKNYACTCPSGSGED